MREALRAEGLCMGRRSVARMACAAAIALAVAGGVTACTPGVPTPVPTYTPKTTNTPTPDPTASPEPTAPPAFDPDASAEDNLDYFDSVNERLFAASGRSDGRTIIDNLVAAGFPKLDMEVTPDKTAIGLQADSIVFAVRVAGDCLVGQFTASGYVSAVQPLLGTGRCLVGKTRAIDW